MSKLALPESFSDAWDIVTSEFRSEMMLMASYKPGATTIVIYLGNFKKLRVPLSWIEEKYPDSSIDPNDLSNRGLGQLLYLGDCIVEISDVLKAFK